MVSIEHGRGGNGSYSEFAEGIAHGLEVAGLPPATDEEIDAAYTVARVSPAMADRAFDLLQQTEGLRVAWTRELFDAAMKLAAYCSPKSSDSEAIASDEITEELPVEAIDQPAAVEPPVDQPASPILQVSEPAVPLVDAVPAVSAEAPEDGIDSDVVAVEPEVASADEPVATEVEEAVAATAVESKPTLDISDEGEAGDELPAPVSPMAAAPTARRRAKASAEVKALDPRDMQLPLLADVMELPDGREFSDLEVDEQRRIVTDELASAFGAPKKLVESILDPTTTTSFTREEAALLRRIRSVLGLHIGGATKEAYGILPDIQQCFGGPEVHRHLGGLLGYRQHTSSKKVPGKKAPVTVITRRLLDEAPKRVHTLKKVAAGTSPALVELNILRGLRFVSLYVNPPAETSETEDAELTA